MFTMKRRFVGHTVFPKVTVENPAKTHNNDKDKPSHRVIAKTVKVLSLLITLGIVSLALGNVLRSLFLQRQQQHIKRPTQLDANVTISNEFVSTFRDVMHRPVFGFEDPVPLVLHNGKLLCRSVHKQQIQNMRVLSFLDMVSRGLERDYYQSTLPLYDDAGVPILLMNGDGMGCNVATRTDAMSFPRLSWSVPAPKHGDDWCHSIGMVSYETWNAFHKRHTKHFTWDDTFANDEIRYPWRSKINKVVWRGTTTHEQTQFGDSDFADIPRAKLVAASMDNPDVIDAGFTKIIQKFEREKDETEKHTRMGEFIPFVQQMKYKAYFDIDGNNWSSRFIMLLCTNSVVVKIDPDYVDYFYEDLIPGLHYIPASLENMTAVAKYVVDPTNDAQMRNVVKAANSWCERTVTEEVLVRDEMFQLEAYESALLAYEESSSWMVDWRALRMSDTLNDFVNCNS